MTDDAEEDGCVGARNADLLIRSGAVTRGGCGVGVSGEGGTLNLALDGTSISTVE